MNPGRQFTVSQAVYAQDFGALRAVREVVFINEQRVPPELELDEADPHCVHVVARDADGNAVGTGRLVPPDQATAGDGHGETAEPAARIGRMAVVAGWRGHGVGDAMLVALLEAARANGWNHVMLHAQAGAIGFYLRHGFLPRGARFMEAGIEHLTMWRAADGAMAITDPASAAAIVVALAASTRRDLRIRSHALDPAVFDAPEVVEALRRLATARRGASIRILLRDAGTPQREHAALIALAQRLPSIFSFRESDARTEAGDASAFVVDDQAGSWHQAVGNRVEGEARLSEPGRARQLRERFDRSWDRARQVNEYRVIGA